MLYLLALAILTAYAIQLLSLLRQQLWWDLAMVSFFWLNAAAYTLLVVGGAPVPEPSAVITRVITAILGVP